MIRSDRQKRRKTRCRIAAICVEFEFDDEIDAVVLALEREGAQIWEIDEDVDLEHFPQGGVFHSSAVFRIRHDEKLPLHELLTTVAQLPQVFSVCALPR